MANTKPGIFQVIRNSLWNPNHDQRSYVQSDPRFGDYNFASTESGEYVSEYGGSRISTVFSCINLIAQDVAQTDVCVYRGSQLQKQSNVYRLLNKYPNEKMKPYAFWYSLVWYYNVYGNSYAIIVRDGNYQPSALIPVHPDHVTIKEGDGQVFYDVSGIGTVPAYNMLHFYLFTYNGLQGVSPIMHNRDVIGKRKKEQKYSARTLGAKPPGYLSGTADTEQQKKISESWKAVVHGDQVHGTPFLTGDLKYTPLSFTPEQAQYIESTIQTNKEIYGIFRVQPTMLSVFDDGVKANAEQQSINHVKYTLNPHYKMIEDEINCKLFSENNKKSNEPLEAKHDSKTFLRGDIETRFKMYHDMILDGVFNADEVRAMEGLEPQSDGLGGKYYIQGAMVEKGKEQDNEQE